MALVPRYILKKLSFREKLKLRLMMYKVNKSLKRMDAYQLKYECEKNKYKKDQSKIDNYLKKSFEFLDRLVIDDSAIEEYAHTLCIKYA